MENLGMLSHLFVTVFLSTFAAYMVNPAIADVVVAAVCNGKDECSRAIYLTGFQQAITGFGSVIMMPTIGKLSDVYGRKTLLTIPLTLAPIPFVVLAWDRTTNFFYAYYAIKTLTAMITDGGILCVALGYLGDSVSETKRVSAFGVLCGVFSAANLCGTFAARVLSTARIFQVAAGIAIVAALYMIIFLKETRRKTSSLDQPMLTAETESNEVDSESSKNVNFINTIPSPKDIIYLLKSSVTFSLLAGVSFFGSMAEAGIISFLVYYLKARFHFKKDQFADVSLITYVGSTVSNLLFLPVFGPFIGEEILLPLGLFVGFLHMFLDSIAWSDWMDSAWLYTCVYNGTSYKCAICFCYVGAFVAFVDPTSRSMVSKQVGPNEQGVAQGCILGITSLANLVSPLIFSPLSALFLSETPPFNFPGFCMLCIGFSYLIGFILSMMIKILPHSSRDKPSSEEIMEA